MRRFLYMCVVMVIASGCSSRSQQAANYNNQIIEMQVKVIDKFNKMDSAKLNFHDVEMMELAHLELQTEIRKSIQELKTMKRFKGDESYLKASIDMFDSYKQITEQDYAELVELLSLPDSSYTKTNEQRVAQLQDGVSQTFDLAHDDFSQAQAEFGKKYNVVFEDHQ